MWALRVLSGPQAGQIIDLKMGRNLIGRSPQCDVKITSAGVSKEHSEIQVAREKIIIVDLKSSNGTYLNGIKIQSSLVRLGDKISIHDIILDIVPAQDKGLVTQPPQVPSNYSIPPLNMAPAVSGDGALPASMGSAAPAPAYNSQGPVRQMLEQFQAYMDRVALPGVYKLPQMLEFRYVLLGFIIVFIVATTLLSMIPMVAITRASIITESKRRAQSIARSVATINQGALMQGNYASLSTNAAEAEDGVKQVLIIQQSDGMILAPVSRAGTTPDLPFVHVARREMRPQTVEVDPLTIGASFPIGLYDPNTGEQSVKAHAIVLYDIGSLAFDDGRALSLFLQTIVLASFIGLLIFYFMYKLIEYPIAALNSQLDIAMREKKDATEVKFLFPPLQALIGNINSLLTRYIHGDGTSSSNTGYNNKDGEAENLVQLIGFPCMSLSREGRIISANPAFAQIVRCELSQLINKPYQSIPDMSVQQMVEHLLNKTRENLRAIHSDNLEFSGHPCILSCQGMSTNNQDVDYFVVTVSPVEGGGG